MKALEKERTRRYESATSLAQDISNYLHDQPVQAGPPSTTYRFRKFARRSRAALATVVLVALAMLIGTFVSVYQAFRATAPSNWPKPDWWTPNDNGTSPSPISSWH